MSNLEDLSRAVRAWSLTASSRAGSGHPTSSLSAADLMTNLLFGGQFRVDFKDHANPGNDRLIFSKGHASPLFYALYATAGVLSDKDLEAYRHLGSKLEGHPRPVFEWAEAATGSLGQGLAVGVGMALAAKLANLPYRTFVLLGDSEMAEGSNWEAINYAGHEQLNGLVGILDVNRLGQRGETMYGRDTKAYEERLEAFGWRTYVIDGHDHAAISQAYEKALAGDGPAMIIASTVKGKGVKELEDAEGWHGKALPEDKLQAAVDGLGKTDLKLRGEAASPPSVTAPKFSLGKTTLPAYRVGDEVATRNAFGETLAALGKHHPGLIVLDAEVGNSTMVEDFQAKFPDRYLEMFIAEQLQVGTALGLSRRGHKPVVSTFAAFLTRAHDQIRMARYSQANITFNGSHAGVSIGQDGPSQMGLEDLALFRAFPGAVVLYPSDATSAAALTKLAVEHEGVSYVRTTRGQTPVIYDDADFKIGGSQTVRQGSDAAIVAAGITLHEALAAAEELAKNNINVRVIDAYSVMPIDKATLQKAAQETGRILVVEDHFEAGGLGDAVREAVADAPVPVKSLAVRAVPTSGSPEELLKQAGIDRASIVKEITSWQ